MVIRAFVAGPAEAVLARTVKGSCDKGPTVASASATAHPCRPLV